MEYFTKKVAIVTGGASGIGKAICTYLAHHGATVILADMNMEGARETESLLLLAGSPGKTIKTDVSKRKDVEALINTTFNLYGRIDLLINNAGIGINGEFQDMTLDHWQHIMDVNFWGTIYGCHYAYPLMIKQGFGQIVNVSSLGGLMSGGLMTAYSASKHAVVGFSLGLRAEAQQHGIKVNTLCPGYLETPIHKTALNVSSYLYSEKNRVMNNNAKYPTPYDCIDEMMYGIRKNKAIIVSPGKHKIYWWLYRLFPSAVPFLWTKVIRNMKKES